jgi:hypothetical protein
MLAVGGDLRKGKAVFGSGDRFFNRANFQEYGERFTFSVGRRPHRNRLAVCYFNDMNILLLIVVLLLLFGGGGFYFGGPVIGGGGLGLILLICLVIYFAGGFRSSKS